MVKKHTTDPVEDWMAECLLLEGEQRESAIEALCAEHPREATEIRERFGVLARLELAGAEPEPFPERLGDFRLLERLGGGGMGVVFRARQESLGREVALKLIRPELLYFPGSRERFEREVLAVARLQHPGIVPVFTIGEEAGLPYFAMELVRGCTLQEVLDRLHGRAPESLRAGELEEAVGAICAERGIEPAPGESAGRFGATWTEACLAIARQVTDALEHAHRRGIVHRDVKPSNVALTLDGRALLLDFGLTASAGETRLTRTGSHVGTIHYMSSEQVRNARHVDGRTDVYSLGVTLFELLTLQVPFHGDDYVDTHRLILEGIDGRGHPLRTRNRAVPVDAETVCLKAMDADPGRRYASAEDFGRDLGNVLERRPIEARPPGPLRRARRFVQRRPALATGLVLGFALAVGLPSALFVQQKAHNEALAGALREAETEALMSAEVSDFLIELFAAPDRINAMGADLPARVILDRGVERLREGALADQPEVRARLLAKMGEIKARLSLFREAEEILEDSISFERGEIERVLGKDHAAWEGGALEPARLSAQELDLLGEGGAVHRYADLRHQLGRVKKSLGDVDEAEVLLREATAIKQAYVGETLELAPALSDWGTLHLDRQDHAAAVPLLERAAGLYAAAFEAGELDKYGTAEYANVLSVLGVGLTNAGRLEPAGEFLRRALDVQESVLPPGHYNMAATLNSLGVLASRQGDRKTAAEYYERALEINRNIVGVHESVARTLHNLAEVKAMGGDFEAALGHFREAREIFDVVASPANTSAVLNTAKLAQLLAQLGRCEEAMELFEEVIPLEERVFAPDYPLVWVTRAWKARCLFAGGDVARARELMLETVEGLEALHGPEHELSVAMRSLFGDILESGGPGGEHAEAGG